MPGLDSDEDAPSRASGKRDRRIADELAQRLLFWFPSQATPKVDVGRGANNFKFEQISGDFPLNHYISKHVKCFPTTTMKQGTQTQKDTSQDSTPRRNVNNPGRKHGSTGEAPAKATV